MNNGDHRYPMCPFLESPRNFSGPESHSEDYRAVLFTYSYMNMIIQETSVVYTSAFLHTIELKMALRERKVSGAFEKRAPRRPRNIGVPFTNSF